MNELKKLNKHKTQTKIDEERRRKEEIERLQREKEGLYFIATEQT